MRLALLAAAALATAGCTKANPDYCDETTNCPGGAACDLVTHMCGEPIDAAAPDVAIQCTADEACAGVCDQNMCVPCGALGCSGRIDGKNVCDGSGVCVECVVNDDCGLSMPICRGEACSTCESDAECETLMGDPGQIGVCNGAGACVGGGEAIFVDASASCAVGDGSATTPYCVIQDGVDDVTAAKSVILVRAGNYAPA